MCFCQLIWTVNLLSRASWQPLTLATPTPSSPYHCYGRGRARGENGQLSKRERERVCRSVSLPVRVCVWEVKKSAKFLCTSLLLVVFGGDSGKQQLVQKTLSFPTRLHTHIRPLPPSYACRQRCNILAWQQWTLPHNALWKCMSGCIYMCVVCYIGGNVMEKQ